MNFNSIILAAKKRRASDVHLEPGLPVTVRVSSNLLMDGETISAEDMAAMAQELVGQNRWPDFIRRGEFHQIASAIETAAESGMWTFTRYREWMANRTNWYVPPNEDEKPPADAFAEQPA